MVGDVAGVEDGRLVVEVHFVDAAQVGTNHTEDLVHIGLGDEHIPVGVADEIDGRDAGSRAEAIRVVLEVTGGEKKKRREDSDIFCH